MELVETAVPLVRYAPLENALFPAPKVKSNVLGHVSIPSPISKTVASAETFAQVAKFVHPAFALAQAEKPTATESVKTSRQIAPIVVAAGKSALLESFAPARNVW